MDPNQKSRTRRSIAAIVLATVTTFATVASLPAGAAPPDDGGWNIVAPADQGLDAAALDAVDAYAAVPARNTQGVVVVRGGEIVNEWYAPGEGPRSWAASWSVAKSVTGLLVGIAIDRGLIAGVDEPMTTWYPDWAGTPKAAITLRDVLQMASGLKWNEGYDPADLANSDVIQMGLAADQLAYAAARPLEVQPGTRFHYSSGDTMLLSGVLAQATGMPVDEFAREALFDPLGITQMEWWRDASGHTLTYCCVDTTTRNFARFGLLMLHEGEWDGTQVVPAQWVRDSLQATPESNGSYGYQWWIQHITGVDGPVAMMNGHDGQFVYAIPSLDMVVARNGEYTKSECAPLADPILFGRYPPNGLIPGAGTHPPDEWNHNTFIGAIVAGIDGPATTDVFPGVEPDPGSRAPDGHAMVECDLYGLDDLLKIVTGGTPEETTPPADETIPAEPETNRLGAATPATAVTARPTYAG